MAAGFRDLRRTAHHGRQCDALVPLRVSRLLQDPAAELGDTVDWGMELWVESKLCGNCITQKPSSATLAALSAGPETLGLRAMQSKLRCRESLQRQGSIEDKIQNGVAGTNATTPLP